MDNDGRNFIQITKSDIAIDHPSWSPDGEKIYFVKDYDSRTEIWVTNRDGSDHEMITNNDARDERPFLSPDASKIVFMSNRDGNYEIYTMKPDGTDQQRITNTPYFEIFPVWSPDGTKIAYAQKIMQNGRMEGEFIPPKGLGETHIQQACVHGPDNQDAPAQEGETRAPTSTWAVS